MVKIGGKRGANGAKSTSSPSNIGTNDGQAVSSSPSTKVGLSSPRETATLLLDGPFPSHPYSSPPTTFMEDSDGNNTDNNPTSETDVLQLTRFQHEKLQAIPSETVPLSFFLLCVSRWLLLKFHPEIRSLLVQMAPLFLILDAILEDLYQVKDLTAYPSSPVEIKTYVKSHLSPALKMITSLVHGVPICPDRDYINSFMKSAGGLSAELKEPLQQLAKITLAKGNANLQQKLRAVPRAMQPRLRLFTQHLQLVEQELLYAMPLLVHVQMAKDRFKADVNYLTEKQSIMASNAKQLSAFESIKINHRHAAEEFEKLQNDELLVAGRQYKAECEEAVDEMNAIMDPFVRICHYLKRNKKAITGTSSLTSNQIALFQRCLNIIFKPELYVLLLPANTIMEFTSFLDMIASGRDTILSSLGRKNAALVDEATAFQRDEFLQQFGVWRRGSSALGVLEEDEAYVARRQLHEEGSSNINKLQKLFTQCQKEIRNATKQSQQFQETLERVRAEARAYCYLEFNKHVLVVSG